MSDSDFHILPNEVFTLIAAESFCTWQLMRRTCKKYHNKLGEYNVLNAYPCAGNVMETRAMFIDMLFSMTTGTSPFVEYCVRVVNKRHMRLVVQDMAYVRNDILIIFLDDKWRTVCEIIKGFTDIKGKGDVDLGKKIRILDVLCTLYEGTYYRGRSRDYIRDNMPELYRAARGLDKANPRTISEYESEDESERGG